MSAIALPRCDCDDESVTIAVPKLTFPFDKPPTVRDMINHRNEFLENNQIEYESEIPTRDNNMTGFRP